MRSTVLSSNELLQTVSVVLSKAYRTPNLLALLFVKIDATTATIDRSKTAIPPSLEEFRKAVLMIAILL